MAEPQSNFDFQFMSLSYKLRDFFKPRMNILKEIGIKPGFQVLDYGCGPGSYILPLAELVGESGRIYALDIHPLAIQKVGKIKAKNKLTKLDTIQSDCKTGLPAEAIDTALLFDILHDLEDPPSVLAELHRVLKPEGVLAVHDHHLKESEIITRITENGLFQLSLKGERVYNFTKIV